MGREINELGRIPGGGGALLCRGFGPEVEACDDVLAVVFFVGV